MAVPTATPSFQCHAMIGQGLEVFPRRELQLFTVVGYFGIELDGAAGPAMTEIFGRRRVPKIADGLSTISYYELWVGRWIPGDGPVLPRAHIIETGTESFRFKRTMEGRKRK